MAFVWNPFSLLGFGALTMAWGLAWLIYRAGPAIRLNRRIALFLALYGVVYGSRFGFRLLTDDPAQSYGLMAVHVVSALAALPTYVLVAGAIESPLSRPFRSGGLVTLLLGLIPTLPLLFFSAPLNFLAPSEPVNSWVTGTSHFTYGGWYVALISAAAAVFAYNLVVAYSAFVRAPRASVARARAKGYILAFGTHDVLAATVIVYSLRFALPGAILPDTFEGGILQLLIAFTPVVLVLLLSHSVLKWHLFDIDLKIKVGIRRGTLAAAALVILLIVEQAVQQYVGSTFGFVAGAILAGIAIYSLTPLQKAAERLADAAMPGVAASPEYLSFRKLQIYRAALEGAMADGEVTMKERAMLAALTRELSIRPEDAAQVERDVAALFPSPRPA